MRALYALFGFLAIDIEAQHRIQSFSRLCMRALGERNSLAAAHCSASLLSAYISYTNLFLVHMRNTWMPKKLRVFHLLQRAHSALFRAADRDIRAREGVTAVQTGVLFVLSHEDGQPITVIADELNMGKSSLTGLIDRMAGAGLVRREASDDDGRVQRVFLEPEGRALSDRAGLRVQQINAEILAPFSQTEQDVIRRFLTHVSEIGQTAIKAGPHKPAPLLHSKRKSA